MAETIDGVSLVSGLSYPESPRWRAGCLWISDVHNFRLKAFAADGAPVKDVPVPGRPAGIGFMPDGELRLATALDRKLCALRDGKLVEVADLSSLVTGLLNDMVVDAGGAAYVGDTGFNLGAGEAHRPGRLLRIAPDGEARIVDEDCVFPNGMVITPDGKTLLLAETFANRITAYDIDADGALSNRRVHATLPGTPDGICLDSALGVWIAMLAAHAFIRIDADGRETHRIDVAPSNAVACMIGGEREDRLFLCHARVGEDRLGFVNVLEAPFPGAGLP